MQLDVAAVRSCFPALAEGAAHFDGPGGSQTPDCVAQAVAETLCSAVANRGAWTRAERRADEIVRDGRAAMADLLGCPAAGVVFGRSMTALTFHLARTLASGWTSADEVIVTDLEHDANLTPWVRAAAATGATVRRVRFEADTADLPVSAIERALSPRTRLVAVTGASNLLGTRPDVAGIAAAAHAAGALVYVDGVHLTPHAGIDVPLLGADFYACSPYKFFGPHLGVLAADPTLLESLHPEKLTAATEEVPERFELGTLPYELLAGTTAAVDFIASLAPEGPPRRARILAGMRSVEEHEAALFVRLLDGLYSIGDVTVHGRPARRTPTVLFSVRGRSPVEVQAFLAARDVNAPAGTFYATTAARRLGLSDAGAVRAGLAPYTDEDDVDRLLAGVASVAGGTR